MQQKKTYSFQSEVKELLNLMIHSLYSNKEIFLRELISNSSDAVDKLKFQAISNPKLYENNIDLKIQISINKKNNTITIDDNGIGMSYEEVIENLGTIAKSGTKKFLKSLTPDNIKNNKLIGQFGVGFYSSFMVAKKVLVYTRYAGIENINNGVLWESKGDGEYSISTILKEKRGTKIVLYLREAEKEYLNTWKIENIVKKYSDHISLPIELQSQKDGKETILWRKINKAQALWTREKSKISKEEYIEFYKYITHDINIPLIWTHNFVEGSQEYINLLFIPSVTPFSLWNNEQKNGLKLYVQRVFIMDNAKDFLPNYLRFTRGIIDSYNLPLNISREILQKNPITKNLKNLLTKRILQMLENMSIKDDKKYQIFWKQFGLILKEGPAEDQKNILIIKKLLRFCTTKSNNEEQKISLLQYVNNMINGQDKIYYITADNYITAKNSPHLEFFYKKNIEVLLFSDRIDEWMISYIKDFNGKEFQSVSKIDNSIQKFLNSETIIEKEKIPKESLNLLVEKIKTYLKDRVKDVLISNRLTDSPAVLITDNKDMSTQMNKLLSSAGHDVPKIRYLLEINSNHKLIKKMINIKNDIEFFNFTELLFGQALLIEKGSLDNIHEFINIMNNTLLK